MIKGGTDGFAVKGGDAAAGPLKLMFDGPRPHGCERQTLLFALHPLTSAAMRSNAKTASLAAQALARAAAGARAHVLHPPAVAVRGQLTLVVKAFVISVFEASCLRRTAPHRRASQARCARAAAHPLAPAPRVGDAPAQRWAGQVAAHELSRTHESTAM